MSAVLATVAAVVLVRLAEATRARLERRRADR